MPLALCYEPRNLFSSPLFVLASRHNVSISSNSNTDKESSEPMMFNEILSDNSLENEPMVLSEPASNRVPPPLSNDLSLIVLLPNLDVLHSSYHSIDLNPSPIQTKIPSSSKIWHSQTKPITWVLVSLPAGHTSITYKWVFRVKFIIHDFLGKYKAYYVWFIVGVWG